MPFEKIFNLIREQEDVDKAWAQVIDLCRESHPSEMWGVLPKVDFSQDIFATSAWIGNSLPKSTESLCIYLGLDTLNMDEIHGENIEIGWCIGSVQQDGMGWMYGDLTYGPPFLIGGLKKLHSVYSQAQWEQVFSFADYILFLVYSALVLRDALKISTNTCDKLVAWGFHDGDILNLCRIEGGEMTLICR